MIDTICLKHISTDLTEAKLASLGATAKAGKRNPTWYLNKKNENSWLPRFTISRTKDGIFHVYAENSVPKGLYLHNSRLPETDEDIQRGIEIICDDTEKLLGIRFEVTTAIMSKIHLTRDYLIGDAANRAVFALYDKRLPYLPKRTITADENSATTLYFNCKSRKRNSVICIYPKHDEVLSRRGSHEAIEASEGILRIEYRANTRSGVKSLLKRFSETDERTLLTRDLNDRVFQSLEEELNFPECISARPSDDLPKLIKKYGVQIALRLFGFLELRRLKGDAELTRSESDRRNFNAARRKCEKAGVWINHHQT